MWFKNKLTGVEWDIDNKDLIERLKADENYSIIDKNVKVETKKKPQRKEV